MTSQFVDLFDKEKYGLNFWAGIAVCAGILLGFGVNAGEIAYRGLVLGYGEYGPDGEPMTWVAVLVLQLRWAVVGAVGTGLVLVASGTLVRKDLLLPFLAAVLGILWQILVRAVGLVDAPIFDPAALLNVFIWYFLMVGSLVVCYRFLQNKLLALALGMAAGGFLMTVYTGVRFSYPIEFFGWLGFKALCTSFIAGVFLFGGIAKHFSTRGMHFGEYGLDAAAERAVASPTGGSNLGKTRCPVAMLLLLIVTLNLYTLGWIYKVYGEVLRRSPEATKVTPGKALGFLFIPLFNLFWAFWLYYDLPRAIERMERADPPSGIAPQSWLISGSLMGCIVVGIIGAYLWPWALYLNMVLLWTGVLLAQSSLNSHWHAHRTLSTEDGAS